MGLQYSDVASLRSVCMETCSEDGCENPAAVRLYIPWDENRDVCTAHGRVLVQQDGVVAEPLDGAEKYWK